MLIVKVSSDCPNDMNIEEQFTEIYEEKLKIPPVWSITETFFHQR